jgi:histidine triad (HIT) family protein
MDCIFCKIISGEFDSSKVYEDDKVLVLMDIYPVNPGHALVIPKEHFETLQECPDYIARHLFAVTKEVNSAVSQSVKCEGIFNAVMNGEAAGQEIFHLHMHVIPRFTGDGFGFKFPPHYRKKLPARADLNETASTIKDNLELLG